MERDFSKFPQDDNGETLWSIASRGIELPSEAEVRFAMFFPQYDDALKFGVFLLRNEYRVKVNEVDDHSEYLGEVLVDIFLDITHENITEAEKWLEEQSSTLGGKNDGWHIAVVPSEPVSMEHYPFPDSQ